jgi:hypothetical protein
MNKHRLVDTCFWDDAYIMKLDPSEKLLFMYLLTNPLTNICGVYQIQMKRIAFDTGFDVEVATTILGRFEKDKKCLYRDGWVAMRNWLKHQNPSPKVAAGIKAQLEAVPEPLAKYVQGYCMDTISHPNPNSNPNPNPNSNEVSTPPSPPKRRSSASKVEFNWETGMFHGISDAKVSKWADAFPALEVDTEINKAAVWLLENPARGHKRNYGRFLVNWMAKSQERGGDRVPVRR